MLVATFLTVGIGILVAMVLSVLYVDRTFRPQVRQCCRCLHSWVGQDKMCNRCQSNSHTGQVDSMEPAKYDWQGHMDTVPMERIGRWASGQGL